MTRQRQPCGTMGAVQRHYRNGEPVCQPCKDARRIYDADRTGRQLRAPAPCGTNAAYERHIKAKEPVDQACRDAHNEYMRAWKRESRRKQREARAASC